MKQTFGSFQNCRKVNQPSHSEHNFGIFGGRGPISGGMKGGSPPGNGGGPISGGMKGGSPPGKPPKFPNMSPIRPSSSSGNSAGSMFITNSRTSLSSSGMMSQTWYNSSINIPGGVGGPSPVSKMSPMKPSSFRSPVSMFITAVMMSLICLGM